MYYWTVHSFFHTADAYGFQVENLSQATQDRDSHFVVHLRTICDSVLYTYLSKVADTAEKRHYLHLSCTAVDTVYFEEFIANLHRFKFLDLHLSIFQPYDLCDLLTARCHLYTLRNYWDRFKSDPERSKEFYYESSQWHTLVLTQYMKFLRMPSNAR